MFLEAVTVCVGYADFLAEAIPYVRPHLDRWLWVTRPDDDKTLDLAHRHNIEVLATEDFHRNGAAFDKARAVDHGMQVLAWKDWVMHLDADIVLPGTFRESLEDAHLDPQKIYGCDRFMIRGMDRWRRLKASGFFDRHARGAHFNVCFPEGFPVGARWADIHQGFVPIGFLQLCHRDAVMRKGVRVKRYAPHGHNDAARTDVQFALQWDRRHRVLLPEVVVGHLESQEKTDVGANWKGRTTKPFGCSCPPPKNPPPS